METAEVTTKIKWGIDVEHSEVAFKIKHMMITNVKGVFKVFGANIYTTGEDFTTAEIDFWIDPASVDTGLPKRDEHLKSPDFFDVGNFKEINFTSNTYEDADNDGRYELWGNLTLKGNTRKVILDVEFGGLMKDPWGNYKAGFTINGKINRKDWGLSWNKALEAGGFLLSDDVSISCELQLIKQSY